MEDVGEQHTHHDISPGLRTLKAKEPAEQAAFWKSCVLRKQAELGALGGLPLDCVVNDVLIRYFGSSFRGINKVFDSAFRLQQDQNTKNVLQKDGLYIALSAFYSMFDSTANDAEKQSMMAGSNEEFERLCETVSLPCNRDSFGWAVRQLRIAILLRHFDLEGGQRTSYHQGQVFHMDYDSDRIFTPFNHSTKTRTVEHSKNSFKLPVIECQIPQACVAEYLFSHRRRNGNVHWAHVQHPNVELIMAIGQVWRFPGPTLAMLCDLKKAQPQISLGGKSADPSKSADHSKFFWSYMVLPAVYLDTFSRESLELYRTWHLKRQDPQERDNTPAKPPRVRVAATYSNLAMMWTSEEASSLVTVCTEPNYIGKWNTDSHKHKRSWFQSFLAKFTCEGWCARRQKGGGNNPRTPDEEQPLLNKDADVEKAMKSAKVGKHKRSPELDKLFDDEVEDGAGSVYGEKATDATVSTIKFEDCFDQVLVALQRENSMLRLGTHWDLLMRICSNRTFEYLDVLETYQAAITRLAYLLRCPKTANKGNLIEKIEQTTLELANLEMLVRPFADYVVSNLGPVMEEINDPLLHHRMQDVQNNMRSFLPKCKSLVDSCANLTVEYDRKASDKMNSILNILTFITFVITPMQLMTGVYGMNWEHFPELGWSHGYHYFWALSIFLSLTFALILVGLQRTD